MARLTPEDIRELGLPPGYTTGEPGWSADYMPQAAPKWNSSDIFDAMAQVTLRGMGFQKGAQIHPLAAQMVESGHDGFADVAQALAAARYGAAAVDHGASAAKVIQAALSTPDFPALLGQTAAGISREYRSQQLQDLLALAYPLEALNYKPSSYSMVDLENLPAPSDEFGKPYTEVNILATGEPFKLLALYAKLGVSIQALANDDRGLIRAGVQAFLTAAARNEAALAYGLIADNAALQDGGVIFHGDFGNLVAAAPLTTAGLGTAFAALRKQTSVSGLATDAAPYAVLTHADDEAAALAAVALLPQERRPRVVSTAYLPAATYWYLMADPQSFPVLGRVTMRGADPSGVSFGAAEVSANSPGVDLPATHQAGWAILGRVGAVRCAKT